eukprot:CAMPEP_0182485400 /NCGR_PEP_ID=MMETSP1319-20130603/45184_1 /TAXON_ID=172717 /ORGANISM="Bolidomonas pacifica, Strain RCC208" /LENGTH=63 /DNA_ID=CAMNT_0024687375 /DNA_START=217 /DNA_END=404 /DNA_ORIENTATION=+
MLRSFQVHSAGSDDDCEADLRGVLEQGRARLVLIEELKQDGVHLPPRRPVQKDASEEKTPGVA